jgi:putative transposase
MYRDMALPQRRSIRLAQYDYRRCGAYFVTICTLNRECLFGEVTEGEMRLSDAGLVACDEWLRSGDMRREVELDQFVIMPNHLHGIVVIVDADGRRNDGDAPAGDHPAAGIHRTPLQRLAGASLGALINGYKAAVTRSLTAAHAISGASVWQRNYYEHVIRNDEELQRIRQYIVDNPAKWALDRENPENRAASAFRVSAPAKRPPP